MPNKNILVLSLTSFAIDTTFASWWMILPLYLERLGAKVADIGISFALVYLCWAISQLPGGLLSDKFGRKKLIIISTSTFIPFYAVMPFLKNWISATAAIALSFFFAGLQNPSFSSIIAESSEKIEVPKAFGFYNFLMNLGWAVGPLIGAFIIPVYGFDAMFTAGALISSFCLLARFYLSEPSEAGEKLKFSLREGLPILMSILIFQLANGIISPLVPIYAERLMKMTLSEVELMFFLAQLLTSISCLFAGSFVVKAGWMKSLSISFFLSGIFSLTWTFSLPYASFILFSLYYIFLFGFAEVSFGTAISNMTFRGNRATVFGTATVISGLSNSAGSYIGGNIWEISQPRTPFFLASILMMISPLFIKRR
mgnify:CR=1 FL=1